MADDVLVMYAGRAVEYGPCKEILIAPEMPYTWGLLSSIPDVTADTDARLIPIPGNPPSLLSPPSGCSFHPRCAHVDKVPGALCATTLPELLPGGRGPHHLKRCHLADPAEIFRREVLAEIAPELDTTTDDLNPEGHPDGAEPQLKPQVASFDELAAQAHTAAQLDLSRGSVLEVDNLKMYFPVKAGGLIRRKVGDVQAVDGVSFQVPRG
eukprot:gene1785-2094_t